MGQEEKVKKIAREVLSAVGGKVNVVSVTHCMTRLRFTLKDESIPSEEKIGEIDGVMGAVIAGGQTQVIIGAQVSEVYKEVCGQIGQQLEATIEENLDSHLSSQRRGLGQAILDYISNAFIPLVPALVGSGMLKGFLSLFLTLGWIDGTSATYAILSAAGNAVFYFIPLWVAYNTAKYLKTNVIVAMVILGALLEPTFTALLTAEGPLSFLGLPLQVINYSSLIIPALVVVPILAQLETALKRFIPKAAQILIVPFVCILIMVPLTVLILGPVTNALTNIIAAASGWLNDTSAILLGILVGGLSGYLTMLGLHMALVPVILLNFGSMGADPVLAFMSATCYAQIGAAFAMAIRSRDAQFKSLAGASGVTALFAGVTEPILFGLCVKYKKSYPMIGIAGAVGGGLLGLFGCKAYGFVNAGLLGIAGYFSDTFPMYVLSVGATLVLGFVLTYFFAVKEETR
jgi:PTS system beta-glucosides-specific IIC component